VVSGGTDSAIYGLASELTKAILKFVIHFQISKNGTVLHFLGSYAFVLIYAIAILFSVLTMIELRKNFFNLSVNKNAQAIERQLTMTFVAQVRMEFLLLAVHIQSTVDIRHLEASQSVSYIGSRLYI
jgi:hypothetical protein